MPKAYNPQEHEDSIYQKWEKSGFFNPDNIEGEQFSIMMPPPNVTGVLHLGHALENTLMDTMARFQRMQGKKVLLLPGTDHAAVATQARVESNLVKEGHEDPRTEFGREGLLEKIRTYAEDSKSTILKQIRKMGTSANWSRLAYTFDEQRNAAVNEVFIRMFNDGLIYRGTRLVNWSIGANSVLSDDELEWEDRQEPFYYIRCGEFVIGTVRPETKCADSPLVVHPNGTYVFVEFTNAQGEQDKLWVSENLFNDKEQFAQVCNTLGAQSDFVVVEKKQGSDFEGVSFTYPTYAGDRQFTVLADEVIDIEKGAGAMTISSSHSADDYDLAKRRGLNETFITKIGFDGKMTDIAGPAAGLPIEQARKKAVEIMKAQGLIVGEDVNYTHRVPLCYRSHTVVEPMISKQWFVDVNKEIPGRGKSLKDLMREAVTTGHNGDPDQKVVITPARFEKNYFGWIDNLRDWCISRQIWWGHRIPVWYREDEVVASVTAPEGDGWTQDEDTLDTWFSSGMWTFSTLKWPAQDHELETFHPTTWMQMGYEILFFWMARMILFSTYTLDQIPFHDAYIHGILRDKDGRKFSKSLGNGIDPLVIIDKYGTDALRYSLIAGVSPGNDARFYEEKVESAQHLVNKLWNIARFAKSQGGDPNQFEVKTLADQWMVSQLGVVINSVRNKLDHYQFSQAAEKLRAFTWDTVADWYVEASKSKPNPDLMAHVVSVLLQLWHPILPFVTEALWQELHNGDGLLMMKQCPRSEQQVLEQYPFDVDAIYSFTKVMAVVSGLRSLRPEYDIAPGDMIRAGLAIEEASWEALKDQLPYIESMGRVAEFTFTDSVPENCVVTPLAGAVLFVPIDGQVDIEAKKKKLLKEKEQIEKYLTGLEKKFANPKYQEHAAPDVIAQDKEKIALAKQKCDAITNQLASL